MNKQELITDIRSLLSEPDPTNSRWTDDELLFWLNLANKEIAKLTKCIKTYTEITYPTTNTLPDNLYMIYEVKVDGKRVRPATIRELNDFASDFEILTGEPQFYYQRAPNTIDLFYKPTSNKTVRIYYYALPNSLVNDSDEPLNGIKQYEIYHDLLEYFCIHRAYLKERIFDVADYYRALFERGIIKMRADISYENDDKIHQFRDISTAPSVIDDVNYLWTGLEKK